MTSGTGTTTAPDASTSGTSTAGTSTDPGCSPVGERCLPLREPGTSSTGDASTGHGATGSTGDASTGTSAGETGGDPCAALAEELAAEAAAACMGPTRLGEIFEDQGQCCVQFSCAC